ncbi:sister chromatid cohesion protein PDS5 homolog D isoform X3 [Coffea arabica]|uniref:Sister chromatid cohesion protein PDS5 homolog D isoform X3 n=1 Tax=Coffea arabica TaxID=13443 RepID=A0ABM4VPS8_COFAR
MDSERELQHKLINAGVKLLVPISSTDDLLASLDKLEGLLSVLGQDPFSSIRDALLPSMKALISDRLFRHPTTEVRISVMSCISEVLRITAPHQPYEDEKMKPLHFDGVQEVFQLTLAAFEKLSLLSGRCYSKALHILEIAATFRCCVILLDLGCNAFVTEIFELFLSTIKFNHPHAVFSNMAEIMTCLIDASDEILLDLLKPLLNSVKKENQITSPASSWLGEKVLKNCSTKVKPYLMNALKSMSLDINDYADIVALLCRDMPAGANVVMEESGMTAADLVQDEAQLCKSLLDDCTAQEAYSDDNGSNDRNSSKLLQSHEQVVQLKSIAKRSVAPGALDGGGEMQARARVRVMPNRRGRKPNSLIKPEEGYEYSGITGHRDSHRIPCKKKNLGKVSSLPSNSSATESVLQPEAEKDDKPSSFPPRTLHFDSRCAPISLDPTEGGKSLQRKSRPRKKESMFSHDVNIAMFDKEGVLLEDQLKKKSLPGSDGCLRTGSDKTENADKKPGRYSRRKKSAVCNNIETTFGMKNVFVTKEKDMQSDLDGKPLLLFRRKDGQKGMKDKEIEKSEGCRKPRIVKEYGEELIGSRIRVWWPIDRQFYEGAIDSFDPLRKKHKVFYVDGDEENLNLKRERWILLGGSSCHQVMVEGETTASHLVETEAQLCKSLIDDCKAEEADTNDHGLDDRSSSKILQFDEKIEQLKSMAEISFASGALESGGEMQPRARVGVTPNRRKRKPNSLIKPVEVYTEGCKKPRIVKEYGEELVGSRIKVWWSMDSEFYEGVIDAFDPLTKKHKVLYVDGNEENLNLEKESWFLVGNTSCHQKKKASTENIYKRKQEDDSVSSEKRYPTRARKASSLLL